MSTLPDPPPADIPPYLRDEEPNNPRPTSFYIGFGLILFAFVLSWWSVTRYRVDELQGVAKSAEGSTEAKMSDEERRKYRDRAALYEQEWGINKKLNGEFYAAHLDNGSKNYDTQLIEKIDYDRTSGTLVLRGWSTWTGWFGVVCVVLYVGTFFAPQFNDEVKQFQWAFPLGGAIAFGLFTLLALVFYCNVPGKDGDGYSQGVDWGNYLAIIGGTLVTIACAFEAVTTTTEHLAELKATAEEDEDEAEEEVEVKKPAAPPPKPAKSRLQDW